MNNISDKIKLLADERGVSLAWVAEKIGMTKHGFYRTLENSSWKVETLSQIAKVLDKPINYFFDENVTKIEGKESIEQIDMNVVSLVTFIVAVISVIHLKDKLTKGEMIEMIEKLIKSFAKAYKLDLKDLELPDDTPKT